MSEFILHDENPDFVDDVEKGIIQIGKLGIPCTEVKIVTPNGVHIFPETKQHKFKVVKKPWNPPSASPKPELQ